MTDDTTEEPIRFETDDPQVWLAKMTERAAALQEASKAAQARMAENRATVENKLMRLTLNSSGAIDEVTFLTPAGAASATELTSSFRELYSKAGAKVARETIAVMSSLASDEDPSLDLIRRSVPQAVRERMEEEDAEAAR